MAPQTTRNHSNHNAIFGSDETFTAPEPARHLSRSGVGKLAKDQ